MVRESVFKINQEARHVNSYSEEFRPAVVKITQAENVDHPLITEHIAANGQQFR